jgi:hypothetical protein
MHTDHEDDLTPAERAAFDALPRERSPGETLEARTVNSLWQFGLLSAPPDAKRWRMQPMWLGMAVAASVALFTSGVVVGQYLSGRHSAEAIVAIHEADTREAAALMQQTGSAYVAALTSLAESADTTKNGRNSQTREVAIRALHAAANEVVKIAPNDPIAVNILRGFDQGRRQESQATGQPNRRQVVWF